MKKLNLKNAQKLSREAQKNIAGGGPIFEIVCGSGCHYDYISNGKGRCIIAPCDDPTKYGTESQDANGRWRCCF